VLVIEPRPGWSAKLVALRVEGDGKTVIGTEPGIVLTLDGAPQAPTDENGELEVFADEKPERLGVATPGWRLVTRTSWQDWGSVFADTGRFTVEDGRVDVFLIEEP